MEIKILQDITTTSGVTTTPEPLTLTPSSNSEKNTDNTFHSFSSAVCQPCEQSCSTSSNNTDESDSVCRFQAQQNKSSHVYDRIRGLKLNAKAINPKIGPGILHFYLLHCFYSRGACACKRESLVAPRE